MDRDRRIPRVTRASWIGLLGLTTLAASVALSGCAKAPDTGFDLDGRFVPFHTWDWQSVEDPRVEAPQSPALLEGRLARTIDGALAERGYVRGREAPDFRVDYRLTIERRSELVEVPMAPYLLLSHDHTASYWIEGTDTERRTVEHLRLAVDVHDQDGRLVWRSAIRRRLEPPERWDLEELVQEVLRRFPKARRVPVPPPDEADQLAAHAASPTA